MKTVLVWVGAALFGFAGGFVGQKLSRGSTNAAAGESSVVRATSFELIDNSGRVLSAWGVDDKDGRIAIWFNDEKGHARAIFGNEAGERPTETTWAGYKPLIEFDQPDGHIPFGVSVDRWGRPHMVMGDSQWYSRVVLGPLGDHDVVTNEPPDPNEPWGVAVHSPQRAAAAVIGVTTPRGAKQPTGSILLKSENQSWIRDANGAR